MNLTDVYKNRKLEIKVGDWIRIVSTRMENNYSSTLRGLKINSKHQVVKIFASECNKESCYFYNKKVCINDSIIEINSSVDSLVSSCLFGYEKI